MEILNHIEFVSSFCVFSYVEHLRKVFINNAGGRLCNLEGEEKQP